MKRSQDFRRAALWLAGVVIAVFAGDRIFSSVLERLLLRSQFRFSKVYAGKERAQIVILGDSRAVSSVYAPAVSADTGLSALNLSYNGLSMRIAEAVLADYIEKNAPPQLVIVEVTCLEQLPLGLMPEMKTYANASRRLESLSAEADPAFATASRFLHLLKFDNEMFLRSLYYLRRSDQDWVNRYTIDSQLAAEAELEPPWHVQAYSDNRAALQRIVRSLQLRHVQVRLLVGPYLPAYARRSANLGQFISSIRNEVRAVDPTLDVWDYSTAVEGTANFADRVHLNDRGTLVLLQRMLRDHFFVLPSQSTQRRDGRVRSFESVSARKKTRLL